MGSKQGTVHLKFLDGVRGLAALYIVLYHSALDLFNFGARDELSPIFFKLSPLFIRQRWAVGTFIVLSGYCLMHSVVLSSPKILRLKNGFWGYMKRRARRILPAYYVTLALCLGLIGFVPGLGTFQHVKWDECLPAFRADIIGSHLLMIQNLNAEWLYKIDSPMWSVATEWQIYFLFPILLFGFRRLGALAATSLAVILSSLLAPVIKSILNYDLYGASPWYFGLFAMGALCAVASARVRSQIDTGGVFRAVVPALAVGTLAGSFLISPRIPIEALQVPVHENLIGISAALLLFYLSARPLGHTARFFERKPFLILGKISYSLYLIHSPILAMVRLLLVHFKFGADSSFIILMIGGGGLSIFVAYYFSKYVEQPFLSRRLETKS